MAETEAAGVPPVEGDEEGMLLSHESSFGGQGAAGGAHMYGFNNVVPRSPEQATDKDSLEKARLTSRRGGHHRFDGAAGNPLQPHPDSLAYQPESERFSTDVVGEEYDRRMRKLQDKQTLIETKRVENYEREARRWAQIEAEYEYGERRIMDLKYTPKAKRNESSVAYDPITLKYNETHSGQLLKYQDDTIRFRAAHRASVIHSRMSSQSYDVITGEPLQPRVRIPDEPVEPEEEEDGPSQLTPLRVDLAYGE